jgi:hypothetical protein
MILAEDIDEETERGLTFEQYLYSLCSTDFEAQSLQKDLHFLASKMKEYLDDEMWVVDQTTKGVSAIQQSFNTVGGDPNAVDDEDEMSQIYETFSVLYEKLNDIQLTE